jgi:hypothetical protein
VVLAPQLRALLAVEGGFTVDAVTGGHARVGIAVCAHPGMSATLGPREWTDHRLAGPRRVFDLDRRRVVAIPGRAS